MQIESGPTVERRVRTAIPLAMIAVFAVWFAYDGWIGYPRKNFEENLLQLPAEERVKAQNAPIYPNLSDNPGTRERLQKIEKDLKKAGDLPARRKVLEDAFSGPPSWESANNWHYFGPSCRVQIAVQNGLPATVEAHGTDKTDSDLFWQRILAVVLAVGTIVMLGVMIRIVRTRLVLDESGLALRGHRPIPWADIMALRSDELASKGWVDLVYNAHGTEERLRLDEYHLAHFNEIIDAICLKKSFANPLPVEASAPSEQP